jgi:hypothetical protein
VLFQQLQREGKLIAARTQALACASESCPAVLQRDCEPAVRELAELTPSVVVGARDAAGNDVLKAQVLLDGEPWLDRLTGASMPLDPGPHVLTFSASGQEPVRIELVLSEREKGRVVTALLKPPAPPAPPAPPPAAPAPALLTRTEFSPFAYVFSGLAIAGLATFTSFGVTSRSRYDDLDRTCAPDCSSDRVRSARSKATIADVGLGVGVLSLGAAAYFWLSPSRVPVEASGLRLQVGASPTGLNASLSRAFLEGRSENAPPTQVGGSQFQLFREETARFGAQSPALVGAWLPRRTNVHGGSPAPTRGGL